MKKRMLVFVVFIITGLGAFVSALETPERTEEELLLAIENTRSNQSYRANRELCEEYIKRFPNSKHIKKVRELYAENEAECFPEKAGEGFLKLAAAETDPAEIARLQLRFVKYAAEVHRPFSQQLEEALSFYRADESRRPLLISALRLKLDVLTNRYERYKMDMFGRRGIRINNPNHDLDSATRAEFVRKIKKNFKHAITRLSALKLAARTRDEEGKFDPDNVIEDVYSLYRYDQDETARIEGVRVLKEIIRLTVDDGDENTKARLQLAGFYAGYRHWAKRYSSRDNQRITSNHDLFYTERTPLEDLPRGFLPVFKLFDREIKTALNILSEIIRQNPKGQFADDAQFLRGLIYESKLFNYRQALNEYLQLFAAYPSSEWMDEAKKHWDEILSVDLQVEAESEYQPGEEIKLQVSVRNAEKISWSLYRQNLYKIIYDKLRADGDNVNIDVSDLKETKKADSTWETPIKIQKEFIGIKFTEPLKIPEEGLYLLVSRAGKQTCRQLLWISSLEIRARVGAAETAVFVTNKADNKPVPNIRVESEGIGEFFTGETDLFGAVILKNRPDRKKFALRIESGGKVAYMGIKTFQQNDNRSNSYYARHPIEGNCAAFIYTDKPIYRPGQTINFKVILRKVVDSKFQNMPGFKITAKVIGAGRDLYSAELTTNQFGTASGAYVSPATTHLGHCQIVVSVTEDGSTYTAGMSESLYCEEYMKPEYRISIKTDKTSYKVGDKVSITAQADYYFGKPVANSSVQYSVYREPNNFYYDFEKTVGGQDGRVVHNRGAQECLILRASGATDAEGKLKIDFTDSEIPQKPENSDWDPAFQADPEGYEKFLKQQTRYDHFVERYSKGIRYNIKFYVTDMSRREVMAEEEFLAAWQSCFVFVKSEKALLFRGDTTNIRILTFGPNGEEIKTNGKLIISLLDHKKRNEKNQPVPQENRIKIIREQEITTGDNGEYLFAFKPDADGKYTFEFYPSGENNLEKQNQTSLWVISPDFLPANYESCDFSNGRYYRSLPEIILDKDNYTVGEIAHALVVIEEPSNSYCFTIEGNEKIFGVPAYKNLGNVALVEFPITQEHEPGVFLYVNGPGYNFNGGVSKYIKVIPSKKIINIKLVAPKQQFSPGERADFTVETTDASGQPVSAELSAAFVDAALLYIKTDTTPDIVEYYHSLRREMRVRGETPTQYHLYGLSTAPKVYEYVGFPANFDSEDQRFDKYDTSLFWSSDDNLMYSGRYRGRHLSGIGKYGGASSRRYTNEWSLLADEANLNTPRKRKKFLDMCYWNPHLVTDKNGKAVITVEFPDNLTTWKATLRAITAESATGFQSAEFRTAVNLVARLQAPRFFMEKDEVTISGNIHNFTKNNLDVVAGMSFSHDYLDPIISSDIVVSPDPEDNSLSRISRKISLGANDAAGLDWRFKVKKAGEAKLEFAARSNVESDAVSLSFPVYQHGAEKTVNMSGAVCSTNAQIDKEANLEFKFSMPREDEVSETKMKIVLSPSTASAMVDALPYLVDYQYGCVEQTMSRFLPCVSAKKALQDTGFNLAEIQKQKGIPNEQPVNDNLGPVNDEKLKACIAAGLKRLYDLQHREGGWGWWEEDETNNYMTAYVMYGFKICRDAGVQVDKKVWDKGSNAFRQILGNFTGQFSDVEDKERIKKAAYICYVASEIEGKTNENVQQLAARLFEHRDKLSIRSNMLLSLTLHKLDESEQAKIVWDGMARKASVDKETGNLHWGTNEGSYSQDDDAVECTALALMVMTALDSKSEKMIPALRWLMNARQNSRWKSTRDTAQAVLALASYLKVSGEINPKADFVVKLDGRAVAKIAVTKENVLTSQNVIPVERKFLTPGEHTLRIEKKGFGNLYCHAVLNYYSMEENPKAEGDALRVERKYYKLVAKIKKTERLMRRSYDNEYENVPCNEIEIVREEIKSPSALTVGDVIEVELGITAKSPQEYLCFEDMKPAGCEPAMLWSGTDSEGRHCEVRDEKVVFFMSNLPAGKTTLKYQLRCEIPGAYHVLPAKGFAMYLPEVSCTSEEMRLEIRDAK